MANRSRLEQALTPSVSDRASLLRFAVLAVLYDPYLGASGLTDDTAQLLRRHSRHMSLSTLRTRVYEELTDSRFGDKTAEIGDLLHAVDSALLRPGRPGAGARLTSDRHRTGSVQLLAGRLYGTVYPDLDDHRGLAAWWDDLSSFEEYRSAVDVVIAAAAAVGWLEEQNRSSGSESGSVTEDVVDGIDGIVCGLCELLGGGLGYTGTAIDRLVDVIDGSCSLSPVLRDRVLARLEQFLGSDPGSNNLLRVLDRCIRSSAPISLGGRRSPWRGVRDRGDETVARICDLALAHLSDERQWSNLWVPDVYGPRLVRLVAHFGDRGQRRRALNLLTTWATMQESPLDSLTRRACVWALLEFSDTAEGRSHWKELHSRLRGASVAGSSSNEALELWQALDEKKLELMHASSLTTSGARDLVTAPLIYATGCVPMHGTGGAVELPTGTGLERLLHCGLRAAFRTDSDGDAAMKLNPAVERALAMLLVELVSTPSAIRARTVHETIENSGPATRLAALRLVSSCLSSCASDPGQTQTWLLLRLVHLAGLRTTVSDWIEQAQEPLFSAIADSLLTLATLDPDDGSIAVVRARAFWSLGDMTSRGIVDPGPVLARMQPRHCASHEEVAVAAVRLIALTGLRHPTEIRRAKRLLGAVASLCKTPGVQQMAAWGLQRLELVRSNAPTFGPSWVARRLAGGRP